MLSLSSFLTIDFLFRCINAGIVFSLIGYFFKKYGLPRVVALLHKEEVHRHAQAEKTRLLEAQLKNIAVQKKDQESDYRLLQARVLAWNRAVADERERYVAWLSTLEESLLQKRRRQKEHIALQKVKKVIIPEVIGQARRELEKVFVHKGEGYIEQVVLRMKDAL